MGERPGAGGLLDDTAALRAGIGSAILSGRDVSLVAPSMGEIPGCAAVEGHVKGEKAGKGHEDTHGVVGIVAIAGILLRRWEMSSDLKRDNPRLRSWTRRLVCRHRPTTKKPATLD